MTLRIRQMTRSDVDGATDALLRGDWGDRRSFFTFAAEHPACDAIVAVDDGRVVGTGVGTRNGAVGWVGTIFVAAERRGAGLGTELTERICDRLVSAGCRTLVLVATEQGRPLYERLGFSIADWYVTLERDAGPSSGPVDGTAATSGWPVGGAAGGGEDDAPGDRPRGPARTLAPFLPGDVAEAAALDRAATGENRAHLLAAFAGIAGGVALRDAAGDLRGFVARAPWGGGATVAHDPTDARRLLDARLAAAPPGHRVRAGTLLSNAAGLAMLAADGWTEAWRAPRLHRGEPLLWQPTALWGQFNHALG